jgi:hypothetical protein
LRVQEDAVAATGRRNQRRRGENYSLSLCVSEALAVKPAASKTSSE